MLDYYYTLRSVLRAHPHLRRCLTRCRHCRIFFFTHPRNVGRTDLGCPYGCRQAHSKKCMAERSAKYYRTKNGKFKKSLLNKKRKTRSQAEVCQKESAQEETHHDVGGLIVLEETLDYLEMVTSLIEGRRVSRDEILTLLRKKMRMRQLSFVKKKKILYAVEHLNENPP